MKILLNTCFHNSGKLLAKTKAGNYIVRITKSLTVYDYKRFNKRADAKKYYFSIKLANI